MSRWLRIALAAVLAAGIIAVAGCGKTPLDDIVEGQSFEMGELRYNVLYDRFLNPQDIEDGDYVSGQPPAGKKYFAVFVLVENNGGDDLTLPERGDFRITDTTITETAAGYEPVESDSLFSFPYGATIGPDDKVPDPDSVAASGPTQGAMVLFLLDDGVTENRPLQLHISNQGEEAQIKLDL
jgi:hypothetical protein